MASNPDVDKTLTKLASGVIEDLKLATSRKSLLGLANRLSTISKELEEKARVAVIIPSSEPILKLAKDCKSCASLFRAMKFWVVTKRFSYRSLWKPVPTALLCRVLNAPNAMTFDEVEQLLRCAYRARNRAWNRGQRSVERQFKGFLLPHSTDSDSTAAAWPALMERFLDALLCMIPAR